MMLNILVLEDIFRLLNKEFGTVVGLQGLWLMRWPD